MKKIILFLLLLPTYVYLSEPPKKKQKCEEIIQSAGEASASKPSNLFEQLLLLASSDLPEKITELRDYDFREIAQKRAQLIARFGQLDDICKEFIFDQSEEIPVAEKGKRIMQTIDGITQRRKEFSQLRDEANCFVIDAHKLELKLDLLSKLAEQFAFEEQTG